MNKFILIILISVSSLSLPVFSQVESALTGVGLDPSEFLFLDEDTVSRNPAYTEWYTASVWYACKIQIYKDPSVPQKPAECYPRWHETIMARQKLNLPTHLMYIPRDPRLIWNQTMEMRATTSVRDRINDSLRLTRVTHPN